MPIIGPPIIDCRFSVRSSANLSSGFARLVDRQWGKDQLRWGWTPGQRSPDPEITDPFCSHFGIGGSKKQVIVVTSSKFCLIVVTSSTLVNILKHLKVLTIILTKKTFNRKRNTIIRSLLSSGEKLSEVRCFKSGNGALHEAVNGSTDSADQSLELESTLIKNGCDVFAKNNLDRLITFLGLINDWRNPNNF